MKKYFAIVLSLALVFGVGCKKGDGGATSIIGSAKVVKYAKYRVGTYKETDLKTWAATIEKTEAVEVLEDMTVKNSKNEDVKITKVKLSDDKEVFVNTDALASKIIVIITNDTKAYQRNNLSSAISGSIPAGTIAFVNEEKAEWLQITVNDLKIYQRWIKDGYSDNQELISDAVNVERAKKTIADVNVTDKTEAMKILSSVSEKGNAISEVARVELGKLTGEIQAPSTENTNTEPMGD